MVEYLLGAMSEQDRDRFAARYFADDALFEQLASVKEELFDAYARNHLDTEERDLFERQFLTTPEGRQEVAFAQALRAALNEKPAPPPLPAAEPAARSYGTAWWSAWTPWHWGWAAATACLLGALLWQGNENQQLRRTLITLQNRQAEQLQLAQSLQDEMQKLRASANPPVNSLPSPQPSVAPSVKPKPFDDSTLALAVPLRLLPKQRSSSDTPETRLPANTQTLTLQIVLDYASAAGSCVATLRAADSRLIARQGGLSARPDPLGGLLAWRIPARQLKPGDYKLQVTGRDLDQGENVTLTYQFRVAPR